MTRRLRPGWLVALFALVVSASAWTPWLTTSVGGGGWASAIGGKHGSLQLPAGFGAGQLIVLLSSALLVAVTMLNAWNPGGGATVAYTAALLVARIAM